MDWWVYAIIWGAIFLTCIIIEINTTDLTCIWFCISSLVSLFLAIFKANIYVQLIVFALLTIILIIATRPLVKKLAQRETIHTNADKVLDMVGIVTKVIPAGEIGEVKVNSELWRAISIETEDIEIGEKVIIKSITGNKLLVAKANSHHLDVL